jgi:hypothetical protein
VASEFVFHIRNAHPEDMTTALAVLVSYPGLNTVVEIVDKAESMGFSVRDQQRFEALMTARALNLVNAERNVLTDKGRTITAIEMNNPDLFADIVHGLQYTLWDKSVPEVNCFSWTYMTFCRMLWYNGTSEINNRRDIASRVEAAAREMFDRSDIALSPKSIGGALLWLSQLRPEVIKGDDSFERRHFCPPELFLLAVDFIYRLEGSDYGSNLLLNDTVRDEICQVCLLEPSSFERVLDYAIAQFDYLEKGMGGGWGRYLTLYRHPELTDFA